VSCSDYLIPHRQKKKEPKDFNFEMDADEALEFKKAVQQEIDLCAGMYESPQSIREI